MQRLPARSGRPPKAVSYGTPADSESARTILEAGATSGQRVSSQPVPHTHIVTRTSLFRANRNIVTITPPSEPKETSLRERPFSGPTEKSLRERPFSGLSHSRNIPRDSTKCYTTSLSDSDRRIRRCSEAAKSHTCTWKSLLALYSVSPPFHHYLPPKKYIRILFGQTIYPINFSPTKFF
jgi:hypothetical protein